MDTATFRILDTISSHLGDSLSINQLTDKIKATYGTAHYANIYEKTCELKKQRLLCTNLVGRSSIIKLNFQNYLLIDFLAEMEIKKKLEFLTNRNDLLVLLAEIEKLLNNICEIRSISAINLAKNIKLNRIELLFLLKNAEEASNYYDDTASICAELQRLQKKYNLKIDSLILNEHDFFDLMKSDEISPLKEALLNKTALFCPQAFWSEIREIAKEIEIRIDRAETRPTDISELNLTYNLSRFGYREFGPALEQGNEICIEYLITAVLLRNDARRTKAVPIILAKNDFKTNLLVFLSHKFGTSGKLLGLLKALYDIKPSKEIEETMRLLRILETEEIQADERSILQEMRLYDAI